MKLADLASLALESLRLHRLRTGLSAVAVAIGATAVAARAQRILRMRDGRIVAVEVAS